MDKNLIVKISNGFGNQMFLYAAAYAFSKKLGYNLLIDDETGVIYDFKKWGKMINNLRRGPGPQKKTCFDNIYQTLTTF